MFEDLLQFVLTFLNGDSALLQTPGNPGISPKYVPSSSFVEIARFMATLTHESHIGALRK